MTKLFLIATAAALTIASGPVAARDAATTATPAASSTTAQAAQPEKKYCVIEAMTGSRIPYKTCQTRAEWLRDGFDPLNPDK